MLKRDSSEPLTLEGYPGRFEWKDNCLVFVLANNNEEVTPIFPMQSTQMSSDKMLLTISGYKYIIGKEVTLGGSITKSVNNKASIVTRGNIECLLDKTITII